MDQFCGAANDTYRRCFCSERFREFRNAEEGLETAQTLLKQFEDNNLNAVGMSADEVSAMYSATAGENAISTDTSAAMGLLDEIGDLLSGKKTSSDYASSSLSLGVMELDFSTDIGDIWSGDAFDTETAFGAEKWTDLSTLEGKELYDEAAKQCLELMQESCANNAILNMSRSAYSILITQDCNLYEKKIDVQRETVKNTVRTAEKYLREARLADFRAHNSADVNECITEVRAAMTDSAACGPNYQLCLDPTGTYINRTTGEPIYKPEFYNLENLINLSGAMGDNLLSANSQFNSELDRMKTHAEAALDTCRTISDTVWDEFKRTALIEIAQAQSDKVESVKNECVAVIKDCYDTASGDLKDFDDTVSQVGGVMGVQTTAAMCKDKVEMCSNLYGGGENGLAALVSFVNTVDQVRVAESCATSLDNYVQYICGDETIGFPWRCRSMQKGTSYADNTSLSNMSGDALISMLESGNGRMTTSQLLTQFALQNCTDPSLGDDQRTFASLPDGTKIMLDNAISNLNEDINGMLATLCAESEGEWRTLGTAYQTSFYINVFGTAEPTSFQKTFGVCIDPTAVPSGGNNDNDYQYDDYEYDNQDESNGGGSSSGGDTGGGSGGSQGSGDDSGITLESLCNSAHESATFDTSTQQCNLPDDWYNNQCATLGGTWADDMCTVTAGE